MPPNVVTTVINSIGSGHRILRYLAGFDPDEVTMVGFKDEFFATEVVAGLGNSEIERIGLWLVSIPVDCSARVLFGSKGNSLMSDIAGGAGVE